MSDRELIEAIRALHRSHRVLDSPDPDMWFCDQCEITTPGKCDTLKLIESADPVSDNGEQISLCGICGRTTSHNHVAADGRVLHTFIHPNDSIEEPADTKARLLRETH